MFTLTQQEVSANSPTDPETGAPSSGGAIGGYNAFWLDRGMRVGVINGEARSSWITDPPNGKMPVSEQGKDFINICLKKDPTTQLNRQFLILHFPEQFLECLPVIRMNLVDVALADHFFLTVAQDGFHRWRDVPDTFVLLVDRNYFRRIFEKQLHPLLGPVHFLDLLLQFLI